MMYARTPSPWSGTCSELFSGRLRWSIRSRPHDGIGDWVASIVKIPFCWTYTTTGFAASRRAAAALDVDLEPAQGVPEGVADGAAVPGLQTAGGGVDAVAAQRGGVLEDHDVAAGLDRRRTDRTDVPGVRRRRRGTTKE